MNRKRAHVLILVLLAAAAAASGCSKAKQKLKMPEIKMITSENILSVTAWGDADIWIAGDHGVIFHSADEGKTWSSQESGVETLLCDIEFVDRSTGWASGIIGTVLHTEDGGDSWHRQQTGSKRHLLDLSFADLDYGWAVGNYATILHTADGGKSWIPQREEKDEIYNKVFFVNRKAGWVVGERGLILRTRDGGSTWEYVVPPFFRRESLEEEYENPLPTLFGLYFADERRGWICGMDSTVLHTPDGGDSWVQLHSGQDILYNMHVKGSRGWAVGNKGVYLLSTDGGITWEKKEKAIKSKLLFSNVFFSSETNGWIVGSTGTVVCTEDGGETWRFRSGMSYEFEGFKMPEALEENIIE